MATDTSNIMSYGNSTMDVDEYCELLRKQFIERNNKLLGEIYHGKKTKDDFTKEVKKTLKSMGADKKTEELVVDKFLKRTFGYGDEIDSLLTDMDISDVKILSPTEIFYKKRGRRFSYKDKKFNGDKDYENYFRMVATKNGRNTGIPHSLQNFTDLTSSKDFRFRITLTSAFLTSDPYPYITIRKIPKVKPSRENLMERGLFDKESSEILISLAKKNKSILFIGEGGSGKTTLMNFLVDYLPKDVAVLVTQENEEIFKNPNLEQEVMCLHTFEEGDVSYTLRQEIRQGLLQDINCFIVGEIKGAEAYDFIIAVNSGTTAWGSAHANSAEKGIDKMVMLGRCAKEGRDFKREDFLRMLTDLDAIVFMHKFHVESIAEPEFDEDEKEIKYRYLYKDDKED